MTSLDSNFISCLPPTVLEQSGDDVGTILLSEYGSIFVAGNGVKPANRLIFRNEDEVSSFQSSVEMGSVRFGNILIELQEKAAAALRNAVNAAKDLGLAITPRSADSGRRSYNDTVGLWHSRVEPALDHWTALGKISPDLAATIRSLSPFDQVPVILSLEQEGIYFAKDLSKSIIYSVAPPGASQHLSMLAFDVTEFNDPRIREILSGHCWYQTVVSDLPHFTYLGFTENELPDRGLKKIIYEGRPFWLPNLD